MWKPPEYTGPCFDFHFDRFEGLDFQLKLESVKIPCYLGCSDVLHAEAVRSVLS